MTSTADLLRAPVLGATARGAATLAVGWCWLMTAGLLTWLAVLISVALVPALGIGLPLLAVSLRLARWFGAVERQRIALQTGVVVPTPERRSAARPGRWAALWEPLADLRAWACATYAFVALLLVSVLAWGVVALLAAATGAAAAPFLGGGDLTAWFEVPWQLDAVGGIVAAAVLVWLATVGARYGTYLSVRLAQALLGPSVAAEARARVRAAEQEARTAERAAQAATATARSAQERAAELTETRAAAVAAADGERRRIERDLHDGVQQRLVALGVDLGAARRRAERDPATAVVALDHAHDEVKASLAELRDLVRGIHPAVLADRGLDAALSALAARSPVPVRVEVDGDLGLASAPAQAAAYFVVAEALTNIAKHADAGRATVRAAVVPADDATADRCRLRVEVIDDGRGGAAATAGSGLAGLRGRVAALDGTFGLDSPTGGGTRLTVEVPCAS